MGAQVSSHRLDCNDLAPSRVNAAEPKFVKLGIAIASWNPPSVAMNPETGPDRD
jgi:hypothetical protein